jgi:hypothetical protein
MINKTKSVAWPPICQPILPPTKLKIAGPDQLRRALLRTMIIPCPYLPPIPKPAEIVDGNIAIAEQLRKRLSGIFCSGICCISESTLADSRTSRDHLFSPAWAETKILKKKDPVNNIRNNLLPISTSFDFTGKPAFRILSKDPKARKTFLYINAGIPLYQDIIE